MRWLARADLAARGVMYVIVGWIAVQVAFALGTGGPQSSNKQSVDLTATLLKYPGGQVLVVVIGLALIGGGIFLAYEARKEKFRRDMELGRLRTRTRRIVEWLGKFGGTARGAVFITAGIFLVVAAVEAKPQQAKGNRLLAADAGVDAARPVAPGPGGDRAHLKRSLISYDHVNP